MRKPKEFDFHVHLDIPPVANREETTVMMVSTVIHMVEKLCAQLDLPSCTFRQTLASTLILSLQRDNHEHCARYCIMDILGDLIQGRGHDMPASLTDDEEAARGPLH